MTDAEHDAMINLNLFENLMCPECGNVDDFSLDSSTTLYVIGDISGCVLATRESFARWGPDHTAMCQQCAEEGPYYTFLVEWQAADELEDALAFIGRWIKYA